MQKALLFLSALLLVAGSVSAMDVTSRCEVAKIELAGAYYRCCMKAEAKAAKKGEGPDFTACEKSYSEGWEGIESKAGGACLVEGDGPAIQTQLDECVDTVVADIEDAPLSVCGDGVADPDEACDWGDLAGENCLSHGFEGGVLDCTPGSCTFDTSGCFDDKVVFVTSTSVSGSFGGLAPGDSLCAARAAAGGLPGTFLVWLGDGIDSPSTRFNRSNVRYVLVDGTVVANSWADLTDGTLLTPINLNEFGATVTAKVWTGVRENGNTYSDPNSHCAGWTGGATTGLYGGTWSSFFAWTADTWDWCGDSYRLYCFQQ